MEIIKDPYKYSLKRVVNVMIQNQPLAIDQCETILHSIQQTLNISSTKIGKCKFVFDIVKSNIVFKKNPKDHQLIINPFALINIGVGDCKSFSLMVYGLTSALGLSPKFRFVSYDNDPQPSHVYVIVDGIIIDATINKFDFEHPYTYKYDY